jgi:hypothetical protein
VPEKDRNNYNEPCPRVCFSFVYPWFWIRLLVQEGILLRHEPQERLCLRFDGQEGFLADLRVLTDSTFKRWSSPWFRPQHVYRRG